MRKPRALIACESSGTMRRAFAARGWEAVSVDLLPADDDAEVGTHIVGDVRAYIEDHGDEFDLLIAHPPCTRLANSGVRWLHERDLWVDMAEGAFFVRDLLNAPIRFKAIENPVIHKYAAEIIGRRQDQFVQPYEHGHGESKRTGFWLENLPKLTPTNVVDGREQRVWKLPPSEDRWKIRSKTYEGIAAAAADQWGSYVEAVLADEAVSERAGS